MTRREFLKLATAAFASAVIPACQPITPTPTFAPTQPPPSATPTLAVPPSVTPTLTATPMPTATATPSVTATPFGFDFVSVRGDQFYWRGARLPINGFNYYPRLHPWKTFNLGEWEPQVVAQELKLGATLGANVVRVFVDANASVDAPPRTPVAAPTPPPLPTYAPPLAQYVKNVREFLDLAGNLGYKTIVTLFDALDWAIYQPQHVWIAEEYLRAFIPSFANDPRILCWDLQNEPDRALRNVGEKPVVEFFKRLALLTRTLAPNHLQTIGWIDRARAKYFPDLDEYLDFWCFHFYDDATKISDLMQFYKRQTRKPVLLEEFGLPSGGPGYDKSSSPEADQARHFEIVLNALEANKMCGSVFWCLNDFPLGLSGNPPIKTDSPENHFGVLRLDYSEKPVTQIIRKFWKP